MGMYIIETFPEEQVEAQLRALISKFPINLRKIYDHGRFGSKYDLIKRIFSSLEEFQLSIIENTPVGSYQHLGKSF